MKENQTTQNKKQRVDFANKIADKVEGSTKFLNDVLFSDEAHFELSGYVNRQNNRIWCEENPHDTIEAPKSREKVTVFVAIGGNVGLIGPQWGNRIAHYDIQHFHPQKQKYHVNMAHPGSVSLNLTKYDISNYFKQSEPAK